MIKKLKTKFILTNMLLISLVLCLSFAIMYYHSANELENHSMEALRDIARSRPTEVDGLFDNKKSKYPHLSTYILDIDTRTNNCYIDGFGYADNLTDENITYINNLINSVKSTGKNEGYLKTYNMRFFVENTPFGKRIVLVDKQYEDEQLHDLLISFLISGGIAFIAFLIISVILANISVKPVEKSLIQQQQLVADVSHELKTPISVIATNTDLILSCPDSTVEEEERWLNYIKDATVTMAELVNNMLYLAKSDETDNTGSFSVFDLSNALYEVVLPFESICFEKGKKLHIEVQNDIYIKGDEKSIKQLFVILLDNAIKYSNADGKIEIALYEQGDKAIFSVFNTGKPIPKESIPHIFERFYRVDTARSRESGGSGLGLAIAKRIIEFNEASISVLSNHENGTVFTCTFKSDKTKKKVFNSHNADLL